MVILLPTILVVCAVVGIIIGVNSNPGGEVPHEHTYTDNVVSPTCTEAGYTEHKCSCGNSYRDNEVAAHHTLTFTAEKTSTCAEMGNTAYYECSVCNKYFSDENAETEITDKNSVKLDMLAHSVALVPEKTATCAEAGNTAYYECSVCNKYFSDENGETEITDKNSVVITESHILTPVPERTATCTENGNIAYYECSECNSYFSDENGENEITDKNSVVTPASHALTFVPEKASTCTEAGNTAYHECSKCNKYYSDEDGENEITDKNSVVITMIPHDYVGDECTVCGATKQPTEGLKYTEHDTYASLDGIGTATDTDIIIADYYNGLPVTRISGSAFYGCSGLTSITIPDSVTSIGDSAFYGCSGLTSITIPNGVTSIGYQTFQNCSGLTSVTIPDGVTSIGGSAFNNCSGLTSVTIGNDVTSISSFAFSRCSGLTSLTIGNSVTNIGSSAFYNCSGLTSITLPFVGASKEATGYQAVFGYIFGYVQKTSTSTVSGATYQCGEFLNNSYYDFHYYIPTSLKSVSITGGDISSHAFYNCSMLTSISIPDSVTSIREDAFYNTIYYNDNSNWKNDVLYIGKHLIKAKNTLSGDYQIKATTLTVADYAFTDCRRLTSITIPEVVTSVGEKAFWGCTGLTSVTIPNGVTSIGSSVFSGCTGLTSATIPDGVTSIGELAFSGCKELTSIIIPDSVISIGSSAFYDTAYYNDNSNWENGVLYIGKHLIIAKTALSGNYQIKAGTLTIADYAFNGCSKLLSVTIPDSVKSSIGERAFYNCSGLTNIIIGNGVTSIGYRAFYGCKGLNSITIPDNVTSVGDEAFYDCSGLTSVTIPNSVTSIGDYAFYNCSGLTSVYYKDTETEWNAITIGFDNNNLTNATRYYYSETEPAVSSDGMAYDGNYWHYDANGEIVVWKKQ